MRREPRLHPLQSFRFWFCVLFAASLGTAWKFDLLSTGGSTPATPEIAHGDADAVRGDQDVGLEPMDGEPLSSSFLDEIDAGSGTLLSSADESAASPAEAAVDSTATAGDQAAAGRGDDHAATNSDHELPLIAPQENPFGPARSGYLAADEFEAAPDESEDLPIAEAPVAASDLPEVSPAESPARPAPSRRRTVSLSPRRGSPARPGAGLASSARRPGGGSASRSSAESVKVDEPMLAAGEGTLGEESGQALADDSRRVTPAAGYELASTVGRRAPNSAQPRTAMLGDSESPGSPPSADRDALDLAEVDRLIDEGDDVAAHRMLSTWYWRRPELRESFRGRMELLADRIYFRSQPHYTDAYIVQAGDVLQSIATEHQVTWQYLATLNRVEPRKLRPGQKLKVLKGPFAAVVDLGDFELTIHAHGYFVRRYEIGVGRDASTPVGAFQVTDKLIDPTYYGQDEVIEHDDPENPLGERWIGLGDSYGIHGTIDPDSIGRAESQGCIRLRNGDVEEVYDFLTIGAEVVIRR